MKKFYAIMEGTKKSTKTIFNKETGKSEEKVVKTPVSQIYVAEGRTRMEALNEVRYEAKKSGRKVSYFGAFK